MRECLGIGVCRQICFWRIQELLLPKSWGLDQLRRRGRARRLKEKQ